MENRGWRVLGLHYFAILCFLFTILDVEDALFAQAPQTPPFQERIVLDTELTIIKQMGAVEDFFRDEQWSDAIEKLRQIRVEKPESLVPVRFGRYVTVETYADLMLANFPPAGLAVYRNRMDSQARRWFDEARQQDDIELLKKVIERAFVSSVGDDALFRLGELAWDRGEPAVARDYWEQILPLPAHVPKVPIGKPLPVRRYPDTDLAQAEILARLILCRLVQGQFDQARAELKVFQDTHPQATGYLAGRDGNLAETLTEVIQTAEKWPKLDFLDDVVSFAKNAARNTVFEKPIDVGAELWTTPEWPMGDFAMITPRPGEFRWPRMRYPVVTGNTVLMCDDENIFAFDLETGRPKWPLDPNDPDTLTQARIYPPGGPILQPGPTPEVVGVPRFTLTVAEDRIYAKMGTPITSQKSNSVQDFDNRIVCLDLQKLDGPNAQDPLVWLIKSSDVPNTDDDDTAGRWLFEGSPMIENGRIFVVMRRSRPQTELRVVCFDAETATLLWSHTIGASIFNLNERRNYASHNLLTVAENTVFCSTEMGAIAALNTTDGRIRWVVTYESEAIENTSDFSDPERIGLTPCVFHDGVIFAAPSDSQDVLAINADTGVVQWSTRIRKDQDRIVHLLGVTDDRVILCGRQVWGLDRQTGRVAYPRIPRINSPPSTGRGLIAGHVVYRPTHETIERLDTRTGRPVGQPIALRQRGGRGGNLTIAGDILLVAESLRLVAYANVGRIKAEAENAVAANSESASAWFQLARAETLAEKLTEAAENFRKSIQFATERDHIDGGPLEQVARERRLHLLSSLIDAAIEQNRNEDAVRLLEDAIRSASDATRRIRFRRQLAELIDDDNPTQAVAVYRQIIADTSNQSTLFERQSWLDSCNQIQQLIQKHGAEIYAPFEQAARNALSANVESEPSRLRRIAARFPLARSVSQAMLAAAQNARDEEDWETAFLLWTELQASHVPADIRQAALTDSATALAANEYWTAAAKTWQELAREFPSARIGPESQPAKQAVPELLAAPPYATELDTDRPVPLPWRKSWTHAIAPETSLVIPVGRAPGAKWESVLLQTSELTCLSATTGKARWSRTWSRPLRWAGYGQRHLLVATDADLTAFELATGNTVWKVRFEPRLPDESATTLRLVPPQVLVISDGEIIALDWENGEANWQHSVPGRLHPIVFADDTHIAFQQIHPPRTIILKTPTGAVASFPLPPEAVAQWQSTPVRVSPQTFAAVDVDHAVMEFAINDDQPMRRYTGPSSHARMSPRLRIVGEALLLFIDGDTVCRLDPDTGIERWSAPLGFPPLVDIDRQTVSDPERLWIAGRRTLRCLSLTDGKTLWKSNTADSPSRAVRRFGNVLVWKTAEATHLLDAKTGQIQQSLPSSKDEWLMSSTGNVVSRQSGELFGWTGGFNSSELVVTDSPPR